MMKKWFFLSLLFLPELGFSQAVFSGKVMISRKQPANGISVVLTQPRNTNILDFATTDKDGFYNVTFLSDVDSLQLNVSALGFASQQKIVSNNSQITDFELVESSIELNEVVVRMKPAVTRSGDTLTFDADRFRGKNDRDLAELLAKIPGIQIEKSGRILYKGFPISKYYIEGLDLLGGRYNLANENIAADAVESIQIFESHQATKVLNGFEIPDEAAINIQLKDGVAFNGKAEFGGGFSPALWSANLTPMIFSKKHQFVGSYQTNNTGKSLFKQAKNLIQENTRNRFEEPERATNMVDIQRLPLPNFEEERWLNNVSHLLTLNQLLKLPNDYELRMNVDFVSENLRQIGGLETTFFTASDSIKFNEETTNLFQNNSLKATFAIEQNKESTFFKNETKFQGFRDNNKGDILRNNEPISQNLQSDYYLITNRLRKIFTFKKQLFTFDSDVRFNKTPQTLTVSSVQFPSLFIHQTSSDSLQQKIDRNLLQTQHSFTFSKNIRRFSSRSEVGFLTENQLLKTAIQSISQSGESRLPADFNNDLNWKQQQYFLRSKIGYRYNSGRVELTAPLTYYNASVVDASLMQKRLQKRFAFEPELLFVYKFADFWNVNFKYGRTVGLGTKESVHFGYILRNYRSINIQDVALPDNETNRFSGSIRLNNTPKSITASLRISYESTVNNLLFINEISENGSVELNTVEQANISNSQIVSASFSKFYTNTRSTLSAYGNFTRQSRPQIINGDLVETIYTAINPRAFTDVNVNPWFGFYTSYGLLMLENRVGDELTSQKSTQHTLRVSLNFNPTKSAFIALQNELYVNRFVNQNSQNLFSDLTFRYTFTKSKIDLEANWNNVFNIKTLTTVSASSFAYSESTYQLRPSQVLVKVRFSFK
jgi:hypothetical protein